MLGCPPNLWHMHPLFPGDSKGGGVNMQETHYPEGTDGRRGVEGSLDGTTAAAPGRESLFARAWKAKPWTRPD